MLICQDTQRCDGSGCGHCSVWKEALRSPDGQVTSKGDGEAFLSRLFSTLGVPQASGGLPVGLWWFREESSCTRALWYQYSKHLGRGCVSPIGIFSMVQETQTQTQRDCGLQGVLESPEYQALEQLPITSVSISYDHRLKVRNQWPHGLTLHRATC